MENNTTRRRSKQIKELINWLNVRLQFVETIIDEAQACHNYGKETEYLGKREAYQECLRRIQQNAA